MKHFLVVTLLFVTINLSSQSTILENQKVASHYMGDSVLYNIYLPSKYSESTVDYPVIYLLHGYYGDHTDWVKKGAMQTFMDVAIEKKELVPAIVVMPDGGNLWYVNAADGSYAYEDFFINELIPHIDKTYRTKVNRDNRAISGLSMGGYGSLHLAMRHPDKFTGVSGLSSALITDEAWRVNELKFDPSAEVVWGITESRELTNQWHKYNPLNLISYLQETNHVYPLHIYIDCGDDDFLTIGNAQFHITLTQSEIEHEYRVRDGGHTWEYWIIGMIEGLKVATRNFGNN